MRLSTPVLAALLVASPALAQTSFRLVDPALAVDGGRLATAGAPLVQEPFGALTIAVPGDGTYTVSSEPFAGARRAGQFDGRGLFFAAAGRSVRLVSRQPILSLEAPASAYVLYTPTTRRNERGAVRLTVGPHPERASRPVARRAQRSAPRAAPQRRPTLTSRPAVRVLATAARSGPDPAPRPAARALADMRADEISSLRTSLARVEADRRRLEAERDRLRAERDVAARSERARVSAWNTQSAAYGQRVEALVVERDRVVRERDELRTALARVEAERAEAAASFEALRRRAEAADAQAERTGASTAEADRLRAELAQARRELEARDGALATLRTERDDRSSRVPALEAEIQSLRSQLALVGAELDAAIADADALRVERDRLREQLAAGGGLEAERAALDRDRAALRADREALDAERLAFEARRAEGASDAADRAALIDELVTLQTEREALVAERDRLADELQALRTERAAARPAAPPVEAPTVRTPTERSDGAVAFLPGFDFARLENPDVVRRRLDEAAYPRWATVGRIEGDVLVLFQADATGRVVRTAVPAPIGGGLDALAEDIVREMRFAPPVVDGQPTGLRSQVVVRFEL